MKSSHALAYSVWLIGLFVVTLGIIAWSDNVRPPLSINDVFPLLGILAFSLMWTHYIAGSIRRKFRQDMSSIKPYFHITSLITLVLILLHPGLFYLQLYIDGFGIPPQSLMAVYGDDVIARLALFLGSLSLIVFLAFELKRKFADKKWWRYVEYANIAAVFAIFYHALTLGGDLMNGWFRVVWFAYGLLLIVSVVYNYRYDRRKIYG